MKDTLGSDMSSLVLSALRQTGEGVAIVDLSGNIIYVNRAFAEAHGYTEDELSGMNLSVFHRKEDMPLVNDANREVVETGSFSGEVPHLHRNGRLFPTLMQSSLVRDARGVPIGIVGTLRDISDLKKGIRETEEAKQLLQSVLNAIPDIIGIQDAHHGVIRYNSAGYAFLGVSPEKAYGRKCYELIGRTEPCDVCATSETYTTRKPARIEKYLPETGVWLDVRSYPIMDENGEIAAVIEHLRDITVQKETAEKQRRLEEHLRLTQKLESLGVMAGGIAHDFNNILMAILGNADLILREENLPETVSGYLKEVVNASKRAAELANLMLDYSGRSEPNKAALNINDLIRNTGKMLEVSVSKKAKLVYDLVSHIPSVFGDAAQLLQVFMNLITNASDSLEGEPGEITLSTFVHDCSQDDMPDFYLGEGVKEGSYAVVSVSDTGSGMDEATQSRIFDPFFTTKFTGRGLGLAAVLGIVRAHSGGITLSSAPGMGTEISVYLPVCEAGEATREAGNRPEGAFHGAGTALVVDDEESVRQVTGKILQKLGYQVRFAANGREALNLIDRSPEAFRFIIMDLTMPEMDGFEAFERIIEKNPNARVIISSGFARDAVMKKFSGKNHAGILQKPFSIDEVNLVIKKAACKADGQ